MLSLKTETDVLVEVPRLIREARLALALRQEDLAKRSGVPIATLRRFERSGRIGFPGFAKLAVTLGLADRLLEALTTKPQSNPKDIETFLALPKPRLRVRVRSS
jgi:transcriptional regulator with XRE-family HTH domain